MPRRRRRPRHADALKLPYEVYVDVNGGSELCGICGRPGKTRRLHRDHDHQTGEPRGLLCYRCNLVLRAYVTLEWLLAAVAYVERGLKRGPEARARYEAGEAFEPVD